MAGHSEEAKTCQICLKFLTLPILCLKYSARNIKFRTKQSDKQSIKQVQATADVQSVLLLLECMSEDVLSVPCAFSWFDTSSSTASTFGPVHILNSLRTGFTIDCVCLTDLLQQETDGRNKILLGNSVTYLFVSVN